MKRVFSLRAYVEDRVSQRENQKVLTDSIKLWAKECDGKTEEEIRNGEGAFRLILDDKWFVEV